MFEHVIPVNKPGNAVAHMVHVIDGHRNNLTRCWMYIRRDWITSDDGDIDTFIIDNEIEVCVQCVKGPGAI